MKTGIFARRAIVDQARRASAIREKLNVLICLTKKRLPVLTYRNVVLRNLCYYYALPRPHRKCSYFVQYGHGKLDLRFVHGRAEKCVGGNKNLPIFGAHILGLNRREK